MISGKKILLIDDEVDLGHILAEMLGSYYKHVDFISDSRAAIKTLSEKTYDLIISDVMMPGLEGRELIRLLRADGNFTPVMLLTAYASKDTLFSAIRLGVVDVLEKPVQEDFLIETIARVLEIEKRKFEVAKQKVLQESPQEILSKKEKMLGLLQVTNEKKKVS